MQYPAGPNVSAKTLAANEVILTNFDRKAVADPHATQTPGLLSVSEELSLRIRCIRGNVECSLLKSPGETIAKSVTALSGDETGKHLATHLSYRCFARLRAHFLCSVLSPHRQENDEVSALAALSRLTCEPKKVERGVATNVLINALKSDGNLNLSQMIRQLMLSVIIGSASPWIREKESSKYFRACSDATTGAEVWH